MIFSRLGEKVKSMRICFVVSEIFHWGVYGGFGFLTRTIGKNLVKAGFEVYVLMPKNSESQRTIEVLDGMIVVGIPSRRALSLYKICNADIYHSQEPFVDTYFAMKMNPNSKHAITFQDPRTIKEREMSVWCLDPRWHSYRFRLTMEMKLRVNDFIIKRAVHKADALYSQAKYVIPKVISMYGIRKPVKFLPNPVEIPERSLKSADEPTVCFLARWDTVKRIEFFFELAQRFPSVKFIAMGKGRNETKDQYLRKKFGGISNVEMPGFVSEEEKSKIMEKSWILVNNSIRECLPIAFLEAAAHKCAILSSNNPDDFAKNFGYYVTDGDYVKGLRFLLENDRWREKGEKGYQYVKETHDLKKVINQHIEVYRDLLEA